MLNSYVQRCQYYYPERFEGAPVDLNQTKNSYGDLKSGYTVGGENSYGKGSELMSDPKARDDLIGQTAIFSFLDGLNQTKGPLTDERMRELSSYAESAPEGKKIDGLGLEKYHRGMWRNQAVADIVEERAEERAANANRQDKQLAASLPVKDRFHLFKVNASDFENFKLKYQSLKGDHLKRDILSDFAEKLSEISDKEALDHFVEDFKNSTDYKVLATGQGLVTKLFSLETSSQKKVEEMIKAREAEIDTLSKTKTL